MRSSVKRGQTNSRSHLQGVHDFCANLHQFDSLDECRADHAWLRFEGQLDDSARDIVRKPDQVVQLLIHGRSRRSARSEHPGQTE